MRLRSSSAFCSSDQTRSWLRRREGCHDLVLLVSSMDFFLGGGGDCKAYFFKFRSPPILDKVLLCCDALRLVKIEWLKVKANSQ